MLHPAENCELHPGKSCTSQIFVMRFMTNWIELQMGTAMGCTISPSLFALAMQVILKAAEGTGEGPHLEDGCCMPPLKAFVDSINLVSVI